MNHITNLVKEINTSVSNTDELKQKNESQLIQIMESEISFEDIPGYEILKDKFAKLGNHLKYEDLKQIGKTYLIAGGGVKEKYNFIKSIKKELSKISGKEFIGIGINIDNFHKSKFEEINKVLSKIEELFNLLEEEYSGYIVLYINNVEQLGRSYNYHEEEENYKCMKITVKLLCELLDNRARKFIVIGQVNNFSQLDCCLSGTFSSKYNIGEEKLNDFFENV